MSSWDGKAINGADLQADLQAVAAEIKKRGLGEVVAESFVDIDARLKALENYDPNRLGDAVADSLDAQVVKAGGVDVRDGSTTTVTFTQASSRGTAANDFASGSTLATLVGKMRKWFADLGSAAWKSR